VSDHSTTLSHADFHPVLAAPSLCSCSIFVFDSSVPVLDWPFFWTARITQSLEFDVRGESVKSVPSVAPNSRPYSPFPRSPPVKQIASGQKLQLVILFRFVRLTPQQLNVRTQFFDSSNCMGLPLSIVSLWLARRGGQAVVRNIPNPISPTQLSSARTLGPKMFSYCPSSNNEHAANKGFCGQSAGQNPGPLSTDVGPPSNPGQNNVSTLHFLRAFRIFRG
jgi:hypothetical protein